MIIKHTPAIAQLMPVREYRCEISECGEVFSNQSHYDLHLRKRHKVISQKPSSQEHRTVFHCPVEKCQYHDQQENGRSFSNLRLVRQHFQKVHMEKKYKCPQCEEKFLLEHHLQAHKCTEHICPVCKLKYGSKSSLRTHMRRKNHLIEDSKDAEETAIPVQNKIAIPSLKSVANQANTQPCNAYVEDTPLHIVESNLPPGNEPPTFSLCYYVPAVEIANEVPLETQSAIDTGSTLHIDQNMSTNDIDIDNDINSFTDEDVERLLRDMETQTDEVDVDAIEALAPLFRDIQTQTHTTPDNKQHQSTMTEEGQQTSDSNSNFVPYEDSMFGPSTSTHMHTQTFFEELALTNIQTQTNWPDELHNTQCTQTCDDMWDDFLDNFQSTYTQTRWLDWQETDNENN